MLLPLVLILASGDADRILSKHAAYVAPRKNVHLTANVQIGPSTRAAVQIWSIRGRALRFEATSGNQKYAYVTANGKARDILNTDRTYDVQPTGASFGIVPSRISGFLASAFSGLLTAPDWRRAFAPDSKWEVTSAETVRTVVTTQDGEKIAFSLKTDGAGKPLQVVEQRRFPTGTKRIWTITKYESVASIPAARFTIPVPDGYVPYEIPTTSGPIPVGQKFPLNGWLQSDGRSVTIPVAKLTLIAYLGRNCPPSAGSRSALAKLRQGGLTVVETYDTSGGPGLSDPKGARGQELQAQATPLFFLVKPSGVIVAEWMGFAPGGSEAFVQGVREAVKEAG